tara:strand:- start:2326 stop:2766 length:441 start_codon:yes stop_codon:yes gene_type:complete
MKRHLNIRKSAISVETLLRRVSKGILTFLPEDMVDDQELATKVVSLILAGIELPVSLALEDENGKYKVVCRGKAIYALSRYVKGAFAIGETSLVSGVSNTLFDDLPNKAENILFEKHIVFSVCLETDSTEEQVQSLVDDFISIGTL